MKCYKSAQINLSEPECQGTVAGYSGINAKYCPVSIKAAAYELTSYFGTGYYIIERMKIF